MSSFYLLSDVLNCKFQFPCKVMYCLSNRFRAQFLTWKSAWKNCPNSKKTVKSALEIENFFFLKLHFFFFDPEKKVIWICQKLPAALRIWKKVPILSISYFGSIVVAHISKKNFWWIEFPVLKSEFAVTLVFTIFYGSHTILFSRNKVEIFYLQDQLHIQS